MGNGAFSARSNGLSDGAVTKVNELFNMMDKDSDEVVTFEEAKLFFRGNFGKLSASAMFNEVDRNGDGNISKPEFLGFWQQVKKSGYKEKDIIEEVDNLLTGGEWVDWDDNRCTGNA
mmetsp:Transcript_78354/g.247643  ORF Transcript_78354/g.247643 Transcript_78354/m.247643 type:complete len:117 (-) Transcript_78354:74-424(-)